MVSKERLRIGIDTTYMDRRKAKGTAILIRHLVEELRKHKDEFEITLIHKESIPEDPIYKEFNEIIIPRIRLPKFSGFFSELFFFLTTRERFDVYFFSYSRIYPTFWLAPAKHIIFAAMDGGPQTAGYKEKAKGKLSLHTRLFIGRIDKFVAISEFGRIGIMNTYGVSSDRVGVVYCGVDESFVPPKDMETTKIYLKRKYGITSPYLLDVSRFDPHKNILNVLYAFERLVKEDKIHENLVFVGGRHMPDYSNKVDALIESLGLKDRVSVAPFISEEDLPKVYQCATYFLFPSFYEGFGMPAIEAMACGTPVLVSNIDALTEVTGSHAEIVNPYELESIVSGMRKLLDKSRRDTLSREGLEWVKKFSWKNSGESLVEIIKSAAGGHV